MVELGMETPGQSLFEVDERKCGVCQVVRPLSMFYIESEKRRALRRGLSRTLLRCRLCQKQKNDNARRPRQDYTDKIKAERGCYDCGISKPEHPEIFDFDHIDPSQKVAGIAKLLTSGTWDAFVAEIEKCQVVCANCHRIRTRTRGAYWKGYE